MRQRQTSLIIDLRESSVVKRYTRAFHCSVQQLRDAVNVVGPKLANVRMRFRRQPMVKHHHRPA